MSRGAVGSCAARCFALFALFALGCGPPARTPAKPPGQPPVGAREAEAPMESPDVAATESPESFPEEVPEDELSAAEIGEQADTPEPRQITYRVTDDGLLIEVEGIRFRPKATAVKTKQGGYQIDLSVVVEGLDDRTHTLLSPTHGPLAMGATIYKKDGSQQARYVDERSGDDRAFVMPGGQLELTRRWPSGSVRGPLWWGQKVKLEVGVWGLGAGDDSGRPLKKLFIVEMVGGARPRPVITPPEL